MKETGVLFSPPMAMAAHAGRKTNTRRVMARQKKHDFTDYTLFGQEGFNDGPWKAIEHAPDWPDGEEDQCTCPYASHRGDLLWVREEHYAYGAWTIGCNDKWTFLRDTEKPAVFAPPEDLIKGRPHGKYGWYKRNSLFMPRSVCRTVLEVTRLAVERLQDISKADALAEGIVALADGFGLPDGSHFHCTDPRISYASLWEHLNGPGSWEANPWVWSIHFKKVEVA